MNPRVRRGVLASLLVVAVAVTAYALRWVIGGQAIEIVDPAVRRWAANEVARLSDGGYRLTATPLQVDAAAHRITIDTIALTTDPVRNAARDRPLPTIELRLHHCAVEGVNLEQLASRRGFSATRAGCDTVQVTIDVPAGVARDTLDDGGFLALPGELDLARGIPFLQIDSVVFPHVSTALSIAAESGRATTIGFDHLAVRLEAFRYDPDEPATLRRTLLSRNVALAVDSLRGTREGADRTELDRLRADLATGTVELTGLRWHPVPGAFTDSLGILGLSVDSLDVAGVDWRAFLTRGDAQVRRFVLRGAEITLRSDAPGGAETAGDSLVSAPWTPAGAIEAFGRRVRLDTLEGHALRLREVAARDTILTTVATLILRDLHADPTSAVLRGAMPIGPARLEALAVARRSRERTMAMASITLDLASGRATLDSVRIAPEGTDADFVRRQRTRRDRIALAVDSVRLEGLDAAAWVGEAAYRARRLAITGLDLDILSDKRLPAGRGTRHLTPQQWSRDVGPAVAIESVIVTGRLQYRERGAKAPRPGVMRFEALDLRLRNVVTRHAPADTMPTTFRMAAQLMGATPLRLEGELPLGEDTFMMSYRGQLGRMRADRLNPFLDGAAGARFTDGLIHGVRFDVAVRDGVARGQVVPRYEGLWIELPGAARTGFLSGLRRAVAKFAANQFVVREDNVAGGPDAPRNGTIAHRWSARETLLQFMWNGLRDGLVAVVKR
jgi:hypothetical protein